MDAQNQLPAEAYADWPKLVAKYCKPDLAQSVWMVVNSFGGYFLCWWLMYLSLDIHYGLTLLLALPAVGFLVRIFIIQHDCGHGSYFKSKRASDIIGFICGVLTLTPYKHWRWAHSIHHAHHAELEERGIGDIWTMTVEEYKAASPKKRAIYRVFRNPLFLFFLAAPFNFVVLNRLYLGDGPDRPRREIKSVVATNIGIATMIAIGCLLFGVANFFMMYVPLVMLSAVTGTWLFYVQHQFERTYWEHTPEWSYVSAAMHGSSYYKLPRIIQFFTGNIGFHHIHHLSPRIPNYKLERCHNENPIFQAAPTLTFRTSLRSASLVLWDEDQQRLLTFREAHSPAPSRVRAAARAASMARAKAAEKATAAARAAAAARADATARAAEAKANAAARAAATASEVRAAAAAKATAAKAAAELKAAEARASAAAQAAMAREVVETKAGQAAKKLGPSRQTT